MSMINVSIVGNLTRAPEQISFASGRIKTVLVIAVNSANHKNQENAPSADFYRVEIWGKLAELSQKYLSKGSQVGVSGRLMLEHWTDKEGQKRVTPVVSATQISFPPRVRVSEKESSSHYETDDDLFAGARAVTVAEPPPQHYAAAAMASRYAMSAHAMAAGASC